MSLPNIEILDTDGAIREAEGRVAGDTRAAFFRKAAVGSGAMLTSGAILGMLPGVASAAPSAKQDLEILNYALTLEYLEAAFYTEAVKNVRDDAKQFAQLVAKHERTHVTALQKTIKALGGKAVKEPKFDFQGTTKDQQTFIETALVLENTGVHAYLGQASRILNPAILDAAASIVTIEARHAAAVATIVAKSGAFKDNKATSITPDGAFDTGFSMKKILAAVDKTNFIKGF
jgi:rubrerythrin